MPWQSTKNCKMTSFSYPRWKQFRTSELSSAILQGFMAHPSTLWMPTRAQDFSFLLCVDKFSFCFYGFWRLTILDTPCKLFQYAARYLTNFTQLLFIYFEYVNNKYSEISTINDNTFSTIFPATNLFRRLEFLVRMYCSIFNLQHYF